MKTIALALLLALPSSAGTFGGTSPAHVVRSEVETQAALNLFVDPTGSDSASCLSTGTSACLTIPGARAKIPPRVRHPVVVTLAAGSYAGAYFTGFTFDPADPTAGAYVKLTSALINATLATGSATGTATAGSAGSSPTFGTLSDSGATWTTNDLRGYTLSLPSGTGSGQFKVICSNTGTVITICGTFSPAPVGASTTYAIMRGGAKITTAANYPASASVATAVGAGLIFSGTPQDLHSVSNAGVFSVDQLWVAPATGNGITVLGDTAIQVVNSRIEPAGAFISGAQLNAGKMFALQSSFLAAANSNGANGNVAGISLPYLIRLSSSLVWGAGSGFGVQISGGSLITLNSMVGNHATQLSVGGQVTVTSVQSSRIDCNSVASSFGYGATTPVNAGSLAPFGASIFNCDMSNCTTGVSLLGPGKFVHMSTVTGTGNATAISLAKGSKVQFASNNTFTGTVELTVDSIAGTIAGMRAETPKAFPITRDGGTPNVYGSLVYE